MTQRSNQVGIRGGEGRAQAEAWAPLDYDAAHPPKVGPAEAGGLMVSSLPLLDCARTSRRTWINAIIKAQKVLIFLSMNSMIFSSTLGYSIFSSALGYSIIFSSALDYSIIFSSTLGYSIIFSSALDYSIIFSSTLGYSIIFSSTLNILWCQNIQPLKKKCYVSFSVSWIHIFPASFWLVSSNS